MCLRVKKPNQMNILQTTSFIDFSTEAGILLGGNAECINPKP